MPTKTVLPLRWTATGAAVSSIAGRGSRDGPAQRRPMPAVDGARIPRGSRSRDGSDAAVPGRGGDIKNFLDQIRDSIIREVGLAYEGSTVRHSAGG
jgi:hypothetical protein